MTTSAEVREFAARLVAVEAAARNRSTQLEHSALEDGALREFDADGNMVAQYGKQFDGTSGAVTLVSPPPPMPSGLTATGQPGGVRVLWDGTFENDITVVAPMDWRQTDVVIGPVGMDPIATPPSGSFTSARGGDLFLPKEPGTYDIALVTRTTAGRPSDPSAVVTVTTTAVVSDAELAAIQTDVDAAQAAADQAQATADSMPDQIAAAKADAISQATGIATTKADAAKADAIASAAADATTKAGNAQSAAIAAAAADATTKANNAQAAAALTAQDKADLAKAQAISAAASDATTKANNAQSAAILAAASDATTKANNAQTAAINAAATDAQNKASLAQANAIAASVPKATIVGATGIYRNLVQWTESVNGATGSLVIDTPINFNNYMTRIEISGYSYQGGLSDIDLTAAFYAYNAAGAPTVVSQQYTTKGSKRCSVRFAWKGDGTNTGSTLSIIIDPDPDTVAAWYYPKLAVDLVQIGQTTPPASFTSGWSINRKTDLTGYTFAAPAAKRDIDDSYSLTQSWRTTGMTTIDGGKITADSITAGQIAANAITALELAADSVIAAKIKAGEVVAGKLAASAVIAGNIAADAVTATTVAAGAIIAGKLATDSVLAANIKAGEVVAGKLAAGAVIAGTIATGAVTTSTLAAGAVTAAAIAAGTIGAREVAIGDLTDMSELNERVPNSVTWGSWTSAMGGTSNQWFTRTGTRDAYFMFRNQKGPVPFKTGDRLRFTFEAYASAAVSVTPYAWVYGNASGATQISSALNVTTTPQTFAVDGPVSVDTLGKTSFLVGVMASALSTTDLFVRNVSVRRMGAGELIVDGSIIAGKMAANSIIAGNIAADAVTATTIAAGAVVAGKLATDSVLAGNIKAGEITAGKLAANAVIAGNIAANAVTAGTIAAGAITAGKLSATAIDGMTITGALIRTAASGTRWELGSTVYGTSNSLMAYTTDPAESSPAVFFVDYDGPSGGNTGSRVVLRSSVDAMSRFAEFGVSRDPAGSTTVYANADRINLNANVGVTAASLRPIQTAYVGSVVTTTSTAFQTYTTGPQVTFAAPASGVVRVDGVVYTKSSVGGQFTECAAFLRTGTTMTGGSFVTSELLTVTSDTEWFRGTGTCVFTGLTPGATYTIYLGYRSGSATNTANQSASRLIVTPCP